MVSSRISLLRSPPAHRTKRDHTWQALSLAVPIKIGTAGGCAVRVGHMTSAVKVKSGFKLAELDLERRLADEASYQQKLRKLQIAMLELEQIYRGRAAARHHRARRLGRLGQEWCHPTPDRKARPALGAGLADRPADPGGAGPPLSLALLAKAAATRPDRDLRPYLVRPGPRRTRRRPIPTQRVAARLRRDQRLREDARR